MGFIYSIKDTYRAAVEASTGGKNTVLYDDKGNPSVMVVIPKFKIKDVIDGGSDKTHPAFIVNGVEKDCIYISKYQNIVTEDRAYSLPGQDPKTSINFDQALDACYKKGPGWHLMSNAEWSAIALWCKKNDYLPRGNNNYGNDHVALHEKGKETSKDSTKTGRVATGSGPCSWSHDGTTDGIYDLNGNVWEWNSGMRIKDGEIQIIPDNNASILTSDHKDSSTLWKAILEDGSLVTPGTANSLKYNNLMNIDKNKGSNASSSKAFESIAATSGTTVPEILKALALAPHTTGLGGDYFYLNNEGERLPIRGGTWSYGANAGVFALYLYIARSNSGSSVGFRSAFVSL